MGCGPHFVVGLGQFSGSDVTVAVKQAQPSPDMNSAREWLSVVKNEPSPPWIYLRKQPNNNGHYNGSQHVALAMAEMVLKEYITASRRVARVAGPTRGPDFGEKDQTSSDFIIFHQWKLVVTLRCTR